MYLYLAHLIQKCLAYHREVLAAFITRCKRLWHLPLLAVLVPTRRQVTKCVCVCGLPARGVITYLVAVGAL